MNIRVDKMIAEVKWCIRHNQHDELEEWMLFLDDAFQDTTLEYRWPWQYIFQQLYLCAVSRNNKELRQYFEEMYNNLDLTTKIALKPTMVYAKYVQSSSEKNDFHEHESAYHQS